MGVGNMLAKLETTYLGILRVIILIVATIALVVAGIALVTAVPPIVRSLGSQSAEPPRPGLSSFIAEKKVEGTTATKSPSGETASFVNPDVKAASANLVAYLKGRSLLTEENWQDLLAKQSQAIPDTHVLDYYAGVNALTDELRSARGKPLSLDRVAELLTWHQQHFVSAVNEQDAQRAIDRAGTTFRLLVAGGAFLFFTLIVFIFLFVKIERSLRVVRTVHASSEAADEA